MAGGSFRLELECELFRALSARGCGQPYPVTQAASIPLLVRRLQTGDMNGTHMPMSPFRVAGEWDHAGPGDWADVLAGFPLFSGIPKRRLRSLAREATFEEFGPGDVVLQKGESGDSLYVVLGGSARARGKRAARALRTGDYFGELGLLGSVPRSATVVATEELHVMRLPRNAFLRIAQREPSISLAMLGTLGAQLRRLEAQAA